VPSFNPLLDPAPAPTPAPAAQAAPVQVAEPPNLFLGVLRRWPWLLLGLSAGLVLGLLYHMQRAPVYQSSAQLNVVKNRPELVAGGAGDARVQYLEDYVAPQVIVLSSETILKLAAEKHLDQEGPYRVPPPASPTERVAFLKARFVVTREKEPGSNIPSNVLLLTFKAADPSDAPKYLRAIIAAYRDNLTGVSTGASATQKAQLERRIADLRTQEATKTELRNKAMNELHGVVDPATNKMITPGISQEELSSIRQRIAVNVNTQTTLKLREIVVEKELAEIATVTGGTRAQRLAIMTRLNVPVERSSIFGDPRDLDSMLASLQFKKSELGVRLGRGHPEMVALDNQIKALEKEIGKRGGPLDDELERYRRKLENEKTGIAEQMKVLDRQIVADEEKTRLMAPLQAKIVQLQQELLEIGRQVNETEGKKLEVSNTQTVSLFEVNDLSKPGDGIQVAPVLVQSLLLGAVVGLLFGAGLGLRAELADRSFRSPTDIRRHLGIPVLGHIPPIRTGEKPEVPSVRKLDPVLAVLLRPRSSEAEAVRGIRTQLLFSTHNRAHQVIQITSPNTGDGKSTLAANLAAALARSEKRVVLVDCDFRKPRVHKLLDLPEADIGLASVVSDQADLGGAIQACEIDNLSLLPCGPRPANPAELLSSVRFQEVLDELRATYDYVILDTPPILAVSDPVAVAPRADGVILVFRMTRDARPAAERAKEELAGVGGRLLGVVVNASTERDMGYGYGYGYRYDYQYADTEPGTK
jgi:capsular exopolysaccharide synthesis family protein